MRKWRINPGTLMVEPEDGQPVGMFTAQDLAEQEWPPCPVCGATIVQDFVNIQASEDPAPVYVPGVWKCPNDCDPRPALRADDEIPAILSPGHSITLRPGETHLEAMERLMEGEDL